MKAHYSIVVDPWRSLMRITLSGFFQPEDVARFVSDRDESFSKLRCGPNQHLTLVDIRDMAVQSQDAVAAFDRAMHTPGIYSRRIAMVTRTSLSRSQIRRAAHGRDIAYFEDIKAAETWVLADNAEAA